MLYLKPLSLRWAPNVFECALVEYFKSCNLKNHASPTKQTLLVGVCILICVNDIPGIRSDSSDGGHQSRSNRSCKSHPQERRKSQCPG